jgi:hypothetical protein
VVLSDGDAAHAAAARAVSMLARAARVPAVRGTLPDDASDVVALFDGPFAPQQDDVFADPFLDGPSGPALRLLLLADDEAAAHAGPVRAVAARSGVRLSDLVASAGRPLERFAFLVARTDFAASYLALGNRIDPARSRTSRTCATCGPRPARRCRADLVTGACRATRDPVRPSGKPRPPSGVNLVVARRR